MSKVLTKAGGIFCAAHRGADGLIHGHTWQVWVTAKRCDATELQSALRFILSDLDHSILDDTLSEGEDLASYVGESLPTAIRVDVCRPLEMIEASWER